MPTYAYYCDVCDSTFEDRKPMCNSDDPALCPECGKVCDRLYRFSDAVPAVIYHGSGWARKGSND